MKSSRLKLLLFGLLCVSGGYLVALTIHGKSNKNQIPSANLIGANLGETLKPHQPSPKISGVTLEEFLQNPTKDKNPTRRFLQLLDGVPQGDEAAFLEQIGPEIDQGRFLIVEMELLCHWIAAKNGSLGLEWLMKLSPQVIAKYDMPHALYSSMAANDFKSIAKIRNSACFQANPDTPALYKGLLLSSPSDAARILAETSANTKDPDYLRTAGRMQHWRVEAALRQNGVEGALALLSQGQGSSSVLYGADGKRPAGSSSGINNNLIYEAFTSLGTIKEVPVADIINELGKSLWFGKDDLETQQALSQIARLDGKTALEKAIKITDSENVNDSRYITAAFTSWAEKDEQAALDHLNSTPLGPATQLLLVTALYQSSKNPEIRNETKQLLLNNGWQVPPDPSP